MPAWLTALATQAFCDSLLESRIKLQKAVGAVNMLPQPPRARQYFDSLSEEVCEVLDEVKELSEELFRLRQVRRVLRLLSRRCRYPETDE